MLRKIAITTGMLIIGLPLAILFAPLRVWNRKQCDILLKELQEYKSIPGVTAALRPYYSVLDRLYALWKTSSHKEYIKVLGLDTLGTYHEGRISIRTTPIFISSIRYKFMDTYFHELRHAIQDQKLNDKLTISRARMIFGHVSYYDSWHERDARKYARRATKVYLAYCSVVD